MGENSAISWTHHTFNAWIGCTKVSPGCANCYAEALMDNRRGRVEWGKGKARSRTAPSTWALPLRWNRKAEKEGVRYRVFCASLADVFDEEAPNEWRVDLFQLIYNTPHLDWLILTKRAKAMRHWMQSLVSCHGEVPHNIWCGVSVEDQTRADERIPILLQTPAVKRFLSVEPLLGPVHLKFAEVTCFDCNEKLLTDNPIGCFRGDRVSRDPPRGSVWCVKCGFSYGKIMGIHWVIVGGESGHGARPMDLEWARHIKAQCVEQHIPFFFKQAGGTGPNKGGNLLDGERWEQMP